MADIAALELTEQVWGRLVGHAYDALPMEACGLLAGPPNRSRVTKFYPTGNSAGSARVYTVESRQHLRADRDAEDRGLQILGVVHSHTHTDAYPSPTDVAQAVDPGWHYLIVSLRDDAPVVRSYAIVDGKIAEERVVVIGR